MEKTSPMQPMDNVLDIVIGPKTVFSVIPGSTRNPVLSVTSGSRIRSGMTELRIFYELVKVRKG
jgi:hypothetical protein